MTPAAASIRPKVPAAMAAAALMVASMSGSPPHVSDARQLARDLRMPFGGSDLLAPQLALGGEGVTTTPGPSAPARLPSHSVTDADATILPATDAATPDVAGLSPGPDPDAVEEPGDSAPILAPPPNHQFSPWEELKTYSNLLFSKDSIAVAGRTTSIVRLAAPIRLAGYTGPIEVSRCPDNHRLDHGLDVARCIAYIDPLDGCIPVQVTNFTRDARSIGSLVPVCQIDYETIVVHDANSTPTDTSWTTIVS